MRTEAASYQSQPVQKVRVTRTFCTGLATGFDSRWTGVWKVWWAGAVRVANEVELPENEMPLTGRPALCRPLTTRELECLTWVCRGKSSRDTGAILGLSTRTVDSYVASAMGKLQARTRVEAVAVAVANGYIDA